MKTAEQMREDAARVVLELAFKWRASAAQQQELYDRSWIGGTENRKNAMTINSAAAALEAVAKIIRTLPL